MSDAPAGEQQISWGALGCPRETGAYIATGLDGVESNAKINVKLIHIFAAENDPSALFTVVALRPPLGPPGLAQARRELARSRLPQQVAVAVPNQVEMNFRLKHVGLLSPPTGRTSSPRSSLRPNISV